MNPIYQALSREAAIAAEHIAIGVTALDRADYARHGHYAQAFFALSTGFERAAKLAFVVDRVLETGGTFPLAKEIKSFGHNLRQLLENTEMLSTRRGLGHLLPRSLVHQGIVNVLTDVANNVTRYYNLDLVGGDARAEAGRDPNQAWYEEVTQPILALHYRPSTKRRDEARAAFMRQAMEGISLVRFTAEDGSYLGDAGAAALQSARLDFAKPYCRMYVMQIARFLARVLSDLGDAGYGLSTPTAPVLSEFFALFNQEDRYFRSRRTWSIYR